MRRGGAQAPTLFRNSQVIPMHLRGVMGGSGRGGTAGRRCNACAQKLLWGLDLGGSLGAGSYSPLLQQELHFQLLHALQGEEETAVVSCVCTSLYTRILATPGDPADMSMSIPFGGPAVLEWGQLFLTLFVPLVSLCPQVFLS